LQGGARASPGFRWFRLRSHIPLESYPWLLVAVK
jgi:hypothetical protein